MLIDSFPAITAARIADFEHDNKIVLSQYYIQFLSNCNGAFFSGETALFHSKHFFKTVIKTVDYLFGLDTGFDYADLQNNLTAYRLLYENANCFLPVATDPYGNLFCMRASSRVCDEILFLNHETCKMKKIANSFEYFLDHLYLNYHVWTETSPVFQLIERGLSIDLLNLLRDKKVNLKEKNDKGGNLLMMAAFYNQPVICQILLKNGMDVNEQDEQGVAPLHLATSIAVMKILIQSGANLEIKKNNGQTPLLYQLSNCHQRSAIELIKQGADLHAVDSEEHDALFYINHCGNNYVKDFLLK